MTAEERRAAARERVKAWKLANGWSLRQQRKRRYARKKAKKKEVRAGVKIELEIKERVEPKEVQETYHEHPALSEGDPETVREHARSVARRNGVGVPAGLMEPEVEGGRGGNKIVERASERGTGTEDRSGWVEKEEQRLQAQIEEIKARRAARDKGVEVELEL